MLFMKAHVIDSDLLSIQESRILMENAKEAQKKLADFSQEELDVVVKGMLADIFKYLNTLGWIELEETGFGNVDDKVIKNKLFCDYLEKRIKRIKCVGIIEEDYQNMTMDIGIPIGVITSFISSIDPVLTVIYEAIIAIKSGNAIVFSPHPNVKSVVGRTVDILRKKAECLGLPEGALSYLSEVSLMSSRELMNHTCTSLIMIVGTRKLLEIAKKAGKPTIYGEKANGIVFIEQSADIQQAAEDIVFSKSFDNGLMTSAEKTIVVERSINEDFKKKLRDLDAYFLNDHEYRKLEELFYRVNCRSIIGKSACELVKMAGIEVNENVKLMVVEQDYVHDVGIFEKWDYCPLIPYYIQDDWQGACEKCIELLMENGNNNTLIIHSQNEDIIRLFACKKPVSRVLVNTPAILGNMGIATNLFPTMILSENRNGCFCKSSEVTPKDLVSIRKVAYGTRRAKDVLKSMENDEEQHFGTVDNLEEEKIHRIIKQLLLNNKN